MGFNSFNFILLFLPILLVVWHLLNRTKKYILADIFLTGMSLYYYYTFGIAFLGILLVSISFFTPSFSPVKISLISSP